MCLKRISFKRSKCSLDHYDHSSSEASRDPTAISLRFLRASSISSSIDKLSRSTSSSQLLRTNHVVSEGNPLMSKVLSKSNRVSQEVQNAEENDHQEFTT